MLEALKLHRRALHRIPEIGFDLPKTREYVLSRLRPLGAKLEDAAGGGILAFFDAGREDAVAFRADMDALMIPEPEGCPFRSEHAGNMHACGHDAHMAMLLTFAEWVSENVNRLPHNLLLIFQPAEESGGGALAIAGSGVLERYKVRRIFAAHVYPAVAFGALASRPGPFMATCSEIHARFIGQSAHAAKWREGRDALLAATGFVHALNAFDATLHMPHLLKICRFRAGSSTNIIPDLAEADGTVRAFNREDFEYLKSEIRRIASEASAPLGVTSEVGFSEPYPPLVNDPNVYVRFREAISGMPYQELPEPDLVSEDFSSYLERVPGMMFYVGLGTGVPLHSPLFHLDEAALVPGVEAFQRLALMVN